MKRIIFVVCLMLAGTIKVAGADEGFSGQRLIAASNSPPAISYPTTDVELNDFMALVRPKNYMLVLKHVYEREPRNEAWAGPVEAQVFAAEAKSQKDGVAIKGGDCRTSLCYFVLQVPNNGRDGRHSARALLDPLVFGLRQAQIPYTLRDGDEKSSNTFSFYIYSLSPPEHYVDAIAEEARKQKMQAATQ